jgi:hypothetical protein
VLASESQELVNKLALGSLESHRPATPTGPPAPGASSTLVLSPKVPRTGYTGPIYSQDAEYKIDSQYID